MTEDKQQYDNTMVIIAKMRHCKCSAIPLIAMLVLAGCAKSDSGDKTSKKVENVSNEYVKSEESLEYKQEVQNFKLEGFSKTGENQWSVQGKFANIVDPDIFLETLKGTSISKDMSVEITAEKGVYNKDTKSAQLEGNVVIILADGGKVFMEHASWNASDEKITTDSYIKIEHSGVTLEGIGAEVKPQQEWAMINTDIKMWDKQGRIITCKGPLEVVYKEEKAILNNDVEIIDAEGKMYADKVIAYFDPEKREIERVEWLGNVRAVY